MMYPAVRRLIFVAGFVAATAWSQPAAKPFTAYDADELIRAIPDLAGMRPATSQRDLDAVLQATGGDLRDMFSSFIGMSAAEDVHEIRFDGYGPVSSEHEHLSYIARFVMVASQAGLDESHVTAATRQPVAAMGGNRFPILDHFVGLLYYLLPEYREESQFRYAGRLNSGGHDWIILTFAQRPESTGVRFLVSGVTDRAARLHGVIWLDAATHRVDRLYAELAEHVVDSPFQTLNTDVVFGPVTFPSVEPDMWLPSKVTVHATLGDSQLHTVHRFSDYRIYDEEPDLAKAATSAPIVDLREDGFEMLARGVALLDAKQPAAAVPALREAVRLEPESALAHHYLAAALYSTSDLAGAEAEVREALKRSPNAGPDHNLLAIVLIKRGDVKGAGEEFRVSARLQPKDAVAQFNLGQMLERLGDRKGALESYRAASVLDPNNVDIVARRDKLERALSASADTTIRVDVRQALVPVIVTDKEGHHVMGLKQSDFRVFEDGVEQKITAFTSETAKGKLPVEGQSSAPEPVASGALATATRTAPRRAYVICLDTLHTAFSNLASVRIALTKLFQDERPGDAQYALLALGRTLAILQDTTSDPSLILKALDDHNFQKQFASSQKSSSEAETREFRRTLEEVRALCDHHDPGCDPRRRALPSDAERIASLDRVLTTSFLRELRLVVEHLATASYRRTMVLVSDGFQLVPGKEGFEMLNAYFPEIPFVSLRALDRMQSEFEPVVRLASKNNIAIHTVDSRGLYTQSFFDASNPGGSPSYMPAVMRVMDQNATDLGATLAEIAAATGGTAFHKSNDILAGLHRAFSDGREYYVLAYVPSNTNLDGKFRTITVQVKNSKLLVRAKRGYWATE